MLRTPSRFQILCPSNRNHRLAYFARLEKSEQSREVEYEAADEGGATREVAGPTSACVSPDLPA